MLQLALELQQQGHVIAWVARRDTEVLKQLSEHPGEVLYASRSRQGSVADWLRLRAKLREWSPDAIVLNDTHSVTLAGLAKWWMRKPAPVRLAYKHTIFPLRSAAKYRWLSDRVVCVSDAAWRVVVDGGLSTLDATVVHGGCPVPKIVTSRRSQLRNELGVQDNEKLVLAVGSLIEVKGHAELIAAFAMQQRKDLILAIAGSGPLAEQLRRQADELGVGGRVRLLGFCDDVNALIDASDLVVHPSHSEGLSLVLIQAKMLAKPIVATKVGGAREVLETGPSVQTGFWPAQPKDVSSLSESICAALATLDHPPAGFLENLRDAQQSTLQRFDIRVSAAKLAQLVHSLLPASS